jgi:hypothetical protein
VSQLSYQSIHSLDRRRFIGGSDARVIMGNDEAALLRLGREKRSEAEPEDLSGNLVLGGSGLSEIAIGPSFAFTVLPHAEALPPGFINELDSSFLKRSLDCLDGFFGNLTPLFFKVDDG